MLAYLVGTRRPYLELINLLFSSSGWHDDARLFYHLLVFDAKNFAIFFLVFLHYISMRSIFIIVYTTGFNVRLRPYVLLKFRKFFILISAKRSTSASQISALRDSGWFTFLWYIDRIRNTLITVMILPDNTSKLIYSHKNPIMDLNVVGNIFSDLNSLSSRLTLFTGYFAPENGTNQCSQKRSVSTEIGIRITKIGILIPIPPLS